MTENNLKVLLLEDSIDDAALIEHMLKREGMKFSLRVVESRKEFEAALEDFQPEVVISDHTLPQFDSKEALNLFKKYKSTYNPVSVFILVTGTVSEEFAVNIMKDGADDYILKDRLVRLPSAITGALEKNRLFEQKRKVEEEKLHLLEILQKSLNEIYIFQSDNLKFKYVNEEALRNLGFSMEEMNEITPLELIEDSKEEEFRQLLLKITETKRGKIFESYGIRKDKSRFPVQIHLQMIEEHGGRTSFLANVLDISEIKSQEQQKELALYIQKTFNENSLKGALRTILEGICRRLNISAADFFAYNFDNTRMERYAHFSSTDFFPQELGKQITDMSSKSVEVLLIKNLQTSGLVDTNEKTLKLKSVKSFPINLGNEIVGVANFYSETETKDGSYIHLGEGLRNQFANNFVRKRTEEELTRIFEYSPYILSVASKDGFFKKVNPSFSRLLGYSIEEILNTPFIDFLHPDDLYTLREWEKNVYNENVTNYENRFRTKNGEYRWISWSVTTFLEDGLSFAAGKDITETKEYLNAIELQNKKLAEIAWEQSHVVRAPLARMMGCIHHLEENNDFSDELLQNIMASAHEIDDIIKTIVTKAESIKNI